MKVVAQGILRHCFFGSYSCVVALEFDNEYDANQALTILRDNWKVGEEHKNILIGSFNSEGIENFKTKFNPKAKACQWPECKGNKDRHAIDGLNHSIDVGPPFTLTIDIEDKNQGKLF